MNSTAACHEIVGCPGLYIDAFRGPYLRKTYDAKNEFILTHYHGDHYGGLPRDGKYQGPALIHCTPVTAALLKSVHNVHSSYIVEHNYGETWTYPTSSRPNHHLSSCSSSSPSLPPPPPTTLDSAMSSSSVVAPADCPDNNAATASSAKVTFYDANHCPGAAIVLIQLSDGTVHLHTGDMRFHNKMKDYPLLQQAVQNRKLDLLYLDTTYCHPKHDFSPQDEAIDTISSHVEQQLLHGTKQQSSPRTTTTIKTLVLLSCYSIGKEKVLWAAATRTNQQIYVTDKKLKMLQCVKGHATEEESSKIIHYCTTDPNQADIHVIRMGLAGEMWPFFRPNFRACADYEEKLTKSYDRVVAFLPTGWANASNWNKKNAIRTKQMQVPTKQQEVTAPSNAESTTPTTTRSLEVQVRCFSYSEHSSYEELVSFVEYLRPRKIIPTVFSDDNERRKIEDRFRNLVDSSRAKKEFFKTMQQQQQRQQQQKPVVSPPDGMTKSKTSDVAFASFSSGANNNDDAERNNSKQQTPRQQQKKQHKSFVSPASNNGSKIKNTEDDNVLLPIPHAEINSLGKSSNSEVISLLDDDDDEEEESQNDTQPSNSQPTTIICLSEDEEESPPRVEPVVEINKRKDELLSSNNVSRRQKRKKEEEYDSKSPGRATAHSLNNKKSSENSKSNLSHVRGGISKGKKKKKLKSTSTPLITSFFRVKKS